MEFSDSLKFNLVSLGYGTDVKNDNFMFLLQFILPPNSLFHLPTHLSDMQTSWYYHSKELTQYQIPCFKYHICFLLLLYAVIGLVA